MTIHEAILHGEKLLAQSGIDQPRWNAERLLLIALANDRPALYSDLKRLLSPSEMQTYDRLLLQRSDHYPLAYIEGTQEFYGRPFRVNENVLIPRPETEEIIHAALELHLPPNPIVLDLGAGSGNISVTLSLEIPASFVVSVELSEKALDVLRWNSQDKIEIVRADLFHTPFFPESFDLIVANPPYVEEHSFETLPAETRWEPRLALVAESVEDVYGTILQQAAQLLKPERYLIFEIGFDQSERIQEIVSKQNELQLLQIRKDQQSIPRTVVLRKNH